VGGARPVLFGLKGRDVTALGNAQGLRVHINNCMFFVFEALKGRDGGWHFARGLTVAPLQGLKR